MEPLSQHRCDACDQATGPDGVCGNPLCNRDVDERGWAYIYAIAMKTGVLDRAIKSYKYDSKWGWGWIFGRVVAGYLRANSHIFREFDAIIPSPTYIGPGGRQTDHTAEVLHRAEAEDVSWPFRFDLMSKCAPHRSSRGRQPVLRPGVDRRTTDRSGAASRQATHCRR